MFQNACRVVHLLLQHHANPNLLCNGHSPLALAIASGNDMVSRCGPCRYDIIWEKWGLPPFSHCWGYYPVTLSCSQIIATHLKIVELIEEIYRYPIFKWVAVRSNLYVCQVSCPIGLVLLALTRFCPSCSLFSVYYAPWIHASLLLQAIEELLLYGADPCLPLTHGVGSVLCIACSTEYDNRRTPEARIKLVSWYLSLLWYGCYILRL